MITVLIILAVAALICAILSAIPSSKCPLWISVMLLCIIELLRTLPIGK
jgi:hypothetical protein